MFEMVHKTYQSHSYLEPVAADKLMIMQVMSCELNLIEYSTLVLYHFRMIQ